MNRERTAAPRRMLVRTLAVMEMVHEVSADSVLDAYKQAKARYLDGDWGKVASHRYGPQMVNMDPDDPHGRAYHVETFADLSALGPEDVGVDSDDPLPRGFVVKVTDGRSVAAGATAEEALGAVPTKQPKPITPKEAAALGRSED